MFCYYPSMAVRLLMLSWDLGEMIVCVSSVFLRSYYNVKLWHNSNVFPHNHINITLFPPSRFSLEVSLVTSMSLIRNVHDILHRV